MTSQQEAVQAKMLLYTTSTNPYYFPGVIIQLYWCCISDYQPRSAIVTATSGLLPFKAYSQAAWCLGTGLPNSICMGVNCKGGSASGRGLKPTPLEKNDRDRNTCNAGNSLRVQSFLRSIPGKIWMPTNQMKSMSARPHVSRDLRARALQGSGSI